MSDRVREPDLDRRGTGQMAVFPPPLEAAQVRQDSAVLDIPNFHQGLDATLTPESTGVIAGDPDPTAGDGIQQDSSGISLYKAGVRTVFLDAATGDATLTGTITAGSISGATITGGLIRSAASGQRVEISSTAADRINWYSGIGSEADPANAVVAVTGSSGTSQGTLRLTSTHLSGQNTAQLGLSGTSQDGSLPAVGQIKAGNIILDTSQRTAPSGEYTVSHILHRAGASGDQGAVGWAQIYVSGPGTENLLKGGHTQLKFLDGASAIEARTANDAAYCDFHAAQIVFSNGLTPIAGPINVTGSRGGNAALASLLSALATIGLITDSST